MINEEKLTILTEQNERPITENEIVTIEKIMSTFYKNIQLYAQPLIRDGHPDGAVTIIPPRSRKL